MLFTSRSLDGGFKNVMILGNGKFTYEVDTEWPKLPSGWSFREVADVAVDAEDNVYVFNRGDHPMIVFDREGNFKSAWGEDIFSRAHGVTFSPDGTLWCADDGDHTVRQCTTEGKVLLTIGTPNKPAAYQSGKPFNRPTKVAFSLDGDLYISDGYGNAKVHRYTASGKYQSSWGDYGTDPGEFNLVHSVVTDSKGKVYIADRENHRVQVFNPDGSYVTQWNNMHRPCGIHIVGELCYIGELPTHLPVNADYPDIGSRVSIYDLDGNLQARLGASHMGEEADQFIAPHGITVDSRGDIYVGEVSWTSWSSQLDPPREVRSFRKLVKQQ